MKEIHVCGNIGESLVFLPKLKSPKDSIATINFPLIVDNRKSNVTGMIDLIVPFGYEFGLQSDPPLPAPMPHSQVFLLFLASHRLSFSYSHILSKRVKIDVSFNLRNCSFRQGPLFVIVSISREQHLHPPSFSLSRCFSPLL